MCLIIYYSNYDKQKRSTEGCTYISLTYLYKMYQAFVFIEI